MFPFFFFPQMWFLNWQNLHKKNKCKFYVPIHDDTFSPISLAWRIQLVCGRSAWRCLAVFLWLQGRENSANFLFGGVSLQASTESFENCDELWYDLLRSGGLKKLSWPFRSTEHMIIIELGQIFSFFVEMDFCADYDNFVWARTLSFINGWIGENLKYFGNTKIAMIFSKEASLVIFTMSFVQSTLLCEFENLIV